MTDLESLFTIRLMRIADIEKALTQQIKLDKKHLAQNFAEQNDLLPSVMRFRDLQKDAAARERRIRRIIATLGEDKFETLSDR